MSFLLPRAQREAIRVNLRILGYASLPEFRQSDRWKKRREKYRLTHEYVCVGCGSRHGLELNHKDYKHLGNERDSELEWRCDACHVAYHIELEKVAKAEFNQKAPPKRKGLIYWIWYALFY